MTLSRRLAMLAPLAVAACGEDAPPRDFPPIRYDYLTRIQLAVAAINIVELQPPTALDAISPAPLAPALRRLIEDRLTAAGANGTAVVTIEKARIVRASGGLEGSAAIRLDILGADGGKLGFAEATAARNITGIGGDLRGALYDVTKQILDDMNVELEFQLRRSLSAYLQTTAPAPAPAAVQQQDLSAPKPAP